MYNPRFANRKAYTQTSNLMTCTAGNTIFFMPLAGRKKIVPKKLFRWHFVPSTVFNLSMSSFLGVAFFTASAVAPPTISSFGENYHDTKIRPETQLVLFTWSRNGVTTIWIVNTLIWLKNSNRYQWCHIVPLQSMLCRELYA